MRIIGWQMDDQTRGGLNPLVALTQRSQLQRRSFAQ